MDDYDELNTLNFEYLEVFIMMRKQVYMEDGWYGYLITSDSTEPYFERIGRVPILEEISVGLESEHITLKISETKFRQKKIALLDGTSLYNTRGLDELTAKGFDVRSGQGRCFVEALRMLVDEQEEADITPTTTFENLGWYPRFKATDTGQEVELLFRANKLEGANEASRYEGIYDVMPQGDYETWRRMVVTDVLPHIGLQIVLLAALSSVVIGLLGLYRNVLRPLYHTHLQSGRGKTTSSILALSTLGSGASSSTPSVNAAGQTVFKQPLMATWGATANAIGAVQRGNFGAVVVLNELGTCLEKDLSQCCYHLSEGTEKMRMTSDLKVRRNEGFACVFLSNGEVPLTSRCRSKTEGLALRILEMDTPLTADADHANRIADVCRDNYGFAAPMLAKHIIAEGGYKPLSKRYDALCRELRQYFPKTPSVERFVQTFVAPCLLTIELSKEALEIPFDADRVLQFFIDYEAKHGQKRATSELSYEQLLQEFAMNHDRFIRRHSTKLARKTLGGKSRQTVPSGKLWGRITDQKVTNTDGRVIIRQYEVFPQVVEDILKKKGHDSVKSCEDAWVDMGVLSYDDDTHRTRKRQIISGSDHKDRMYVFLEFEEPDDEDNALDTPSTPEGGQEPKTTESRISYFLQDDDDDDFDDFSYLEEDDDNVA